MCGFPNCNVRKGDKHQISRHWEKKHPHDPNKCVKDQDVDPLAAAQLKALDLRGIEYERIAGICKATCIADLGDSGVSPFGTPKVLAASPIVRVPGDSLSVPVSPIIAGLGPPRNLRLQTNTGSSRLPTAFPPTPVSIEIDDIVDLLVPYIHQLNLATPHLSTPETQEQHLQHALHQLGAATLERLHTGQRRRSKASTDMTYTQLLGTQDLNIATPPLTRTTSTSASYASLRQHATAGGASEFGAAAIHEKLWQSQDTCDTVFEPRSGGANGGWSEWGNFGVE
jgi:hypothetical protein